jgi:hypothetical protein
LSMRSRRSSKSASWALSASICARSSVGESAPGAAPAACEELLLAAPFMSAALLLLLPLKLLLLLWCQSRAATAQQGPLGARRLSVCGGRALLRATEAFGRAAERRHAQLRKAKQERAWRPSGRARARGAPFLPRARLGLPTTHITIHRSQRATHPTSCRPTMMSPTG